MTAGMPARATLTAPIRIPGFLALAVCILLAGFGLRVWELGQPSLWADEIMTEYRVQAPLGEALENTLHTIDQTPLFFIAMRLFPNGSEFALRLPVALLGMVGVGLIMGVARRLLHNDALALWVGAWVAVNPYHIWLSRTARHYSLIFIFSLLITYTFLVLWRGRTSRRNWIFFTLSSMLGYITHYSLLALPFSQLMLMALHWRERRNSPRREFTRRWVGAQVVAAAPMAIWFVLMALTASSREPQWGDRPGLRDLVLTLRNLTAGIDGPFAWYSLPGLIVAAGALLLLAVSWWRIARSVRPVIDFWLILALLPIALVFVLSVVALNAYIDRYFMALLPAIALLIAYVWVVLVRPRARWATLLALAAVLLTGVITVGRSLHNNTLQREDWRGAAALINQQYQPDDIFVVDRAVTMRSLRRYLAEPQPQLAAPQRVIQLSESDIPVPPDEAGARYWVIYRAPDEDIHRVGTLPRFDPLAPQHSVMADWLLLRAQYVVESYTFDGVTILLLNLE